MAFNVPCPIVRRNRRESDRTRLTHERFPAAEGPRHGTVKWVPMFTVKTEEM